MRPLHHDHRRAIPCEDRHCAWKDASVDPEKTVSANDILALLEVRPSKLVRSLLSLDLILEELKRPNNPERARRHDSGGEELALLCIHEARLSPAQIQHANEAAKQPYVPEQDD